MWLNHKDGNKKKVMFSDGVVKCHINGSLLSSVTNSGAHPSIIPARSSILVDLCHFYKSNVLVVTRSAGERTLVSEKSRGLNAEKYSAAQHWHHVEEQSPAGGHSTVASSQIRAIREMR